jgi:hypothetical protein
VRAAIAGVRLEAGGAPALNYQQNLSSRIARIRIVCDEPNTEVSFDGKHVFVAPGQLDEVVLPGEHQVVASRPGFLTASDGFTLAPGSAKVHEVHLVAYKAPPPIVRPWPVWKPWAVGGAGVVAASVGGIFYLLASDNFASYDLGITKNCSSGCSPARLAGLSSLTHLRSLGYAEQATGGWLAGLGAGAIITGIIGVLLDEPRAAVDHVVATPVPAGAAVTVNWQF